MDVQVIGDAGAGRASEVDADVDAVRGVAGRQHALGVPALEKLEI